MLAGRLHLLLGELDLTLGPGEVAEFDTPTPHWFGSAGIGPVEVIVLFSPQGERIHVRAAPQQPSRGASRSQLITWNPARPPSLARTARPTT